MRGRNKDDFDGIRENRPHIRIDKNHGDIPSTHSSVSKVLPYHLDMDTNEKSEYSDIQTRTSYVDAALAREAIKKGKAEGNTRALAIRSFIQRQSYSLGCFIQKHPGKILFVGIVLLSLCCIGLKNTQVETSIEKLWIEEGGRLQKELEYTKEVLGEGAESTSVLLLQRGDDILTSKGMLEHLHALQAATKVSVHLFDTTWNLDDLCIKVEFPTYEMHTNLESFLHAFSPCLILTPLDCFWEGSKLHGPDHTVPMFPLLKWSNLHPLKFIEELNQTDFWKGQDLQPLKDVMDRAGVTSGYTEKPCLNTSDPKCLRSAPNYNASTGPNIGAALTGGCEGLAPKFMRWQEELIVGGVIKNKSGTIIHAEAIMSLIQLMGPQTMYDYHHNTLKTSHINWNQTKATLILEAWQREYTQEMISFSSSRDVTQGRSRDEIYAYSETALNDILREYSQITDVHVVVGFLLMLAFVCFALLNWTDFVQSQCTMGILGVLLIVLSLAAGMGASAWVVEYNATSLQIIPFLALGLGVTPVFLIAAELRHISAKHSHPYEVMIGECLKRVGPSVVLSSICVVAAFFIAAIIPIPALRTFAIQAAIVLTCEVMTALVLVPALVSFDLQRRKSGRLDFFCCFTGEVLKGSKPKPSNTQQTSRSTHTSQTSPASPAVIHLQQGGAYYNPGLTHTPGHASPPLPLARSQSLNSQSQRGISPPPPYSHNAVGQDPSKRQAVTMTTAEGGQPTTVLAPPQYDLIRPGDRSSVYSADGSLPASVTSSQQCLTSSPGHMTLRGQCLAGRDDWFLPFFAKNVYGPQLEKTPFKVICLILFSILLVCGIIGAVRLEDGLDVTDIVPKDTPEYSFLQAQAEYFGFYHFFAVTTDDFDYPEKQALLFDYHSAFRRVDHIVREPDGTLPPFWLLHMRNWLQEMQAAFDHDKAAGRISRDQWHRNATDDGITGYILLLQTGDQYESIDTSRFDHGRLVHEDGTIDKPAFYNYLSAWYGSDVIAYSLSQAMLHPLPPSWTLGRYTTDYKVKVDKALPLKFAQLAFYLYDMSDTPVIVDTITEVRDICDDFASRGLPNFPRGVPFTYWEQYVRLRLYLGGAIAGVLTGVCLALAAYLWNIWIALINVTVLGITVVELMGLMGLFGVKLSAIPAVILIVSAGLGVQCTVHISLGFLTCLGSRTARARGAVEHFLVPVTHGVVATFLSLVVLAFTQYDFIFKYFFVVLSLTLLLSSLNGLLLLPILLSMFGPAAEVRPMDGSDILTPPTPEPSPEPVRRPPPRQSFRRPKLRNKHKLPPRVPSDISLTTITEESSQHSSPGATPVTSHHTPPVTSRPAVTSQNNSGSTHAITVEPHVIVETHPHSYSSTDSANSSPSTTPPPQRHMTRTKVKATVKVEVHTPQERCAGNCERYKGRRRRSRDYYTRDDPAESRDSPRSSYDSVRSSHDSMRSSRDSTRSARDQYYTSRDADEELEMGDMAYASHDHDSRSRDERSRSRDDRSASRDEMSMSRDEKRISRDERSRSRGERSRSRDPSRERRRDRESRRMRVSAEPQHTSEC